MAGTTGSDEMLDELRELGDPGANVVVRRFDIPRQLAEGWGVRTAARAWSLPHS